MDPEQTPGGGLLASTHRFEKKFVLREKGFEVSRYYTQSVDPRKVASRAGMARVLQTHCTKHGEMSAALGNPNIAISDGTREIRGFQSHMNGVLVERLRLNATDNAIEAQVLHETNYAFSTSGMPRANGPLPQSHKPQAGKAVPEWRREVLDVHNDVVLEASALHTSRSATPMLLPHAPSLASAGGNDAHSSSCAMTSAGPPKLVPRPWHQSLGRVVTVDVRNRVVREKLCSSSGARALLADWDARSGTATSVKSGAGRMTAAAKASSSSLGTQGTASLPGQLPTSSGAGENLLTDDAVEAANAKGMLHGVLGERAHGCGAGHVLGERRAGRHSGGPGGGLKGPRRSKADEGLVRNLDMDAVLDSDEGYCTYEDAPSVEGPDDVCAISPRGTWSSRRSTGNSGTSSLSSAACQGVVKHDNPWIDGPHDSDAAVAPATPPLIPRLMASDIASSCGSNANELSNATSHVTASGALTARTPRVPYTPCTPRIRKQASMGTDGTATVHMHSRINSIANGMGMARQDSQEVAVERKCSSNLDPDKHDDQSLRPQHSSSLWKKVTSVTKKVADKTTLYVSRWKEAISDLKPPSTAAPTIRPRALSTDTGTRPATHHTHMCGMRPASMDTPRGTPRKSFDAPRGARNSLDKPGTRKSLDTPRALQHTRSGKFMSRSSLDTPRSLSQTPRGAIPHTTQNGHLSTLRGNDTNGLLPAVSSQPSFSSAAHKHRAVAHQKESDDKTDKSGITAAWNDSGSWVREATLPCIGKPPRAHEVPGTLANVRESGNGSLTKAFRPRAHTVGGLRTEGMSGSNDLGAAKPSALRQRALSLGSRTDMQQGRVQPATVHVSKHANKEGAKSNSYDLLQRFVQKRREKRHVEERVHSEAHKNDVRRAREVQEVQMHAAMMAQ